MELGKREITEYLYIDLDREMWCCNRCGAELISARDNYKKGCLVYGRDPREIHNPIETEGFAKTPREGFVGLCSDPTWVVILEFYCPGCGVIVETESLPLGHPITHDIELDIDKLKEKAAKAGKGA
jgi:acetophenone carboxylase